jgi:hypothetical protein
LLLTCVVFILILQVRRGLLKTATKELGGLLQSLAGLQDSSLRESSSSSEELAAAVLCSKLMKRRTLLCCKADPQQPVSRLRCCGWTVSVVAADSAIQHASTMLL